MICKYDDFIWNLSVSKKKKKIDNQIEIEWLDERSCKKNYEIIYLKVLKNTLLKYIYNLNSVCD